MSCRTLLSPPAAAGRGADSAKTGKAGSQLFAPVDVRAVRRPRSCATLARIHRSAAGELTQALAPMKYLLDTCVFNWIVNGTHAPSDLPVGDYLVTHIQRDEIEKVSDEGRRNALLGAFDLCEAEQVPTGVFVVGVSRVGQAAVGDGGAYHRIFTMLSSMDSRNRKHQSHMADAIIGATAHARQVGLVTADADFFQVMKGILPECHLVLWRKD
jgi:hypothetical protein